MVMWNAEADAKLMAKIIQVCDVKMNGTQMAEIANEMDCTPKAISHRMTHFRKLAAAKASSSGDKPAAKSAKPATPKKAAGRGKKARAETTPSEDGELPSPPASRRSKRAGSKRNYAEVDDEDGDDEEPLKRAKNDDGDGMNDGVKIEVGEDIGEGLRQGAGDGEDDF